MKYDIQESGKCRKLDCYCCCYYCYQNAGSNKNVTEKGLILLGLAQTEKLQFDMQHILESKKPR